MEDRKFIEACKQGNLELCKSLYEQDPTCINQREVVNELTKNHHNAFYTSLRYGQPDCMKFVHEKDPQQVNQEGEYISVYHDSVDTEFRKCLEYLYEINPTKLQQSNLFSKLCENRHDHCARFVLEKDPTQIIKKHNGVEAVYKSAFYCCLETLKLIWERSPEQFSKVRENSFCYCHETLKFIWENSSPKFSLDHTTLFATVLVRGCKFGFDCAEFILEKFPQVLYQPVCGETLLQWIVDRKDYYNYRGAIDFILEKDPTLISTYKPGCPKDNFGFVMTKYMIENYPECLKSFYGSLNYMMYCIEKAFNDKYFYLVYQHDPDQLNFVNEEGKNAVVCVVSCGKLEILKFLHKKHPELLRQLTPLGVPLAFYAASHKQLDCLRFLYEHYPEQFSMMYNDGTILEFAKHFNRTKCIEFLETLVSSQ